MSTPAKSPAIRLLLLLASGVLMLGPAAALAQSASSRPSPGYRGHGQYRAGGQSKQMAFSQSRGGFVGSNRIRQPGSLFPHKFKFDAFFHHPVHHPVHHPSFGGHGNVVFVPTTEVPVATAPQPQPVAQVPSQPAQPIYIVVQPPGEGVVGETDRPASREPSRQEPSPQPRPEEQDRRPGEILFSIEPPDAAVFLDERPLGPASELNARSEALVARSGVHVLEVVHPDHETGRLFFGVEPAGVVHVRVDLGASNPRRRARLEKGGDLFGGP